MALFEKEFFDEEKLNKFSKKDEGQPAHNNEESLETDDELIAEIEDEPETSNKTPTVIVCHFLTIVYNHLIIPYLFIYFPLENYSD